MKYHNEYSGGELEGKGRLIVFDIQTVYGGVVVMLDVGRRNNCKVEVGERRKVYVC